MIERLSSLKKENIQLAYQDVSYTAKELYSMTDDNMIDELLVRMKKRENSVRQLKIKIQVVLRRKEGLRLLAKKRS